MLKGIGPGTRLAQHSRLGDIPRSTRNARRGPSKPDLIKDLPKQTQGRADYTQGSQHVDCGCVINIHDHHEHSHKFKEMLAHRKAYRREPHVGRRTCRL